MSAQRNGHTRSAVHDLPTPTQRIRHLLEEGYSRDMAAEIVVKGADMETLRWMALAWANAEADYEARFMAREIERAEAVRLRLVERDREPTEDEREKHEARLAATRARKQAARDAGFKTVSDWKVHLEWEQDAQEAAELGYASVEEFRAAPDRFGRRIKAVLDDYLDESGARAAMQFTEAFLNTEFALGDGHRVTWGEATVADLQTRITMMTKMIEGCDKDIALHRQVLELLVSSGARCLNELRERGAAADEAEM